MFQPFVLPRCKLYVIEGEAPALNYDGWYLLSPLMDLNCAYLPP
jgi:hypothetical protein